MSATDPLSAPPVAAAELPPAAEAQAGIAYPLHPRVHELWSWQGAILGGLIALGWLVPAAIFGIANRSLAQFGVGVLLAALLGLLAWRLMVGYHRAYAREFRCVLLPDGLLVQRGVFWRRQTFVPRARVQHTDVNEGPIARYFGIATLIVFTAGTAESQIEVEGLPRDGALDLRDRLLGRDGHDAV